MKAGGTAVDGARRCVRREDVARQQGLCHGLCRFSGNRRGNQCSRRCDRTAGRQCGSSDARLSALEWQVVALARRDRLSSLREPSRLTRAFATIFGETRNPRLADPSLEALRRMAVLSWHHGYSVTSSEVRAFTAAGYTPDQYELMVDSIGVALAGSRRAARVATAG